VKARLQEVAELQADRERTRAALAAARDRLQVYWTLRMRMHEAIRQRRQLL
jgi:hypothetical protein